MSYTQLILDKLKPDSPDFDELCNRVSDIKQLSRSGNKGGTGDKEVHPSSVEKYAVSRQKNVRNVKGSCMVAAVIAKVRAIQIMVFQARHVISVA
jgi:hypothetical protein